MEDNSELETERLVEALILVKERLDDMVSIASKRGLTGEPYDPCRLMEGTAKRIDRVLEGGRFNDDIYRKVAA